MSGNLVEAAGTGIDLRGTTGVTICRDDVFTEMGAAAADLPVGAATGG